MERYERLTSTCGLVIALSLGVVIAICAPRVAHGQSSPAIASSTYLGGGGHPLSPDKDTGNDVAVDAAGNVYVAGATNSLGRWDADVFVRKFDPTGAQLLYETVLDSNGTDDAALGIAVDGAGNAYVTGRFGDALLQGGLGVFVAKLGATGDPLYQVVFGADGDGYSADLGARVAVDATGNAYVAGTTFASFFGVRFPTTPGAYQEDHGGGLTDAFVVKLDPSGQFVYSTFLGGAGYDRAWGIAVDAAGSAYVVGDSDGDFPTTSGAFQENFAGLSDVFVAKLDPSGAALVYATYLGGNGGDEGFAIALDGAGNAHVTGSTYQYPTTVNDFPVRNAFQPTYGGGLANAFVAKLDAAGSGLLYSSYMGGGGSNLQDVGTSIKVDSRGHAHLAGRTETVPDSISGNRFPIANAFQAEHGGGVTDAFITELTPIGAVVSSSYLGASDSDQANAVTLDAAGNAYVAGRTASQDFPILHAYQPEPGGGTSCDLGLCPDAFLTKVASESEPPPSSIGALDLSAGRIRFASSSPDQITLRGAIVPDTSDDLANSPASIEVENSSGLLLAASLPAGALEKRGAVYLGRDPLAGRTGGIGLLRVVQRTNHALSFALRAYGDLSAATRADMTIRLTIGGRSYATSGTWRLRSNGWSWRP